MRVVLAYATAVVLDQSGILSVVGHEGAGDGAGDGVGGDVPQAGAKCERLLLAGAGRQDVLGYCVAGQDDSERRGHGNRSEACWWWCWF